MAKISYTENVLKKDNIRIFTFRDRYLLVTSADIAIMMFEKVQTSDKNAMHTSLNLLAKDFTFPLSSYPFAAKTAYPNIPEDEFAFICKCYSENVVTPRNAMPFMHKVKVIQFNYKISMDLAKLMAKLPDSTNLDKVNSDIKKARNKLGNNTEVAKSLLSGPKQERKAILKTLLPSSTYKLLDLDNKGWRYLSAVCEEIAKGCSFRNPVV